MKSCCYTYQNSLKAPYIVSYEKEILNRRNICCYVRDRERNGRNKHNSSVQNLIFENALLTEHFLLHTIWRYFNMIQGFLQYILLGS